MYSLFFTNCSMLVIIPKLSLPLYSIFNINFNSYYTLVMPYRIYCTSPKGECSEVWYSIDSV